MRNPDLQDLNNWPSIAVDSIDQAKREDYRKNWRAIKMALEGHSYQEIQKVTGRHPSQITRLLKRALAGPEDCLPPLTQALIPGKRLQKAQRRIPLSRINAPTGSKGSLRHLLDVVPNLRENLDRVLEESISHSRRGENITPAAFHQYFLMFLVQAGHPDDSYPFTGDRLGYESLRLYMYTRMEELLMERLAKHQPKRIIAPHERPFEVGREIQIDEQTYDGESSVYLELSGNLVPVRVARFALVQVSDADSTCVLSFRLAFTQHCSQFDVLSTLETANIPTEPAKLRTPGIHVPLGPCFPNQLGEEFACLAFNTVALDNALAHCADSVEKYICDYHFGTSNLGLPATPTPRHVIEQAFRLISRNAKRHKSTSGSHPKDPLRETSKQKKRPPAVTVFELEEAIYAVLAKHNTEPKPHLMGNSPLDIYKYMIQERPLRLLPPLGVGRRSPFELSKQVSVKWLKQEMRTPHINFYGCRYKGSCLTGLENQTVTVIFDYRDIRQLRVKTADGRIVGSVHAPKTWQHFPHGIKTRQYIMRYCRVKRLHMKDPLVEYFWLQLQRKNSKNSSLEMLRLYREYTGLVRPRLETDEDDVPVTSSRSTESVAEESSSLSIVPSWTPEIANAHRTS